MPVVYSGRATLRTQYDMTPKSRNGLEEAAVVMKQISKHAYSSTMKKKEYTVPRGIRDSNAWHKSDPILRPS
jgi:hypothetical protein